MRSTPKKRKNRLPLYYKIHRYLGLAVALFLIWLAVSGILLNHTETLKLDESRVNNAVVDKLYGVKKPQLGHTFKLKHGWLLKYGDNILLNEIILMRHTEEVLGALQTDQLIAVASPQQVILFSAEGELIDNLSAPEPIQRLGQQAGLIIVQSATKNYALNDELTDWIETTTTPIWINASTPPQTLLSNLQKTFNGEGPTLEQVILDAHSGRLFKQMGVYLVDLVALLTILLTVIGVYLWLARIRRQKK